MRLEGSLPHIHAQALLRDEYYQAQENRDNELAAIAERKAKAALELAALQADVRSVITDKMSDWQKEGNCITMENDIFFPSKGRDVDYAKSICADCPVKSTCLEFAIDNKIDKGVWGGTSERERRKIIRQRKMVLNQEQN